MKRLQPIPDGARCACGCDQPIAQRRENGTRRYVPIGQTVFYLHGHNPRGKGGEGHHLWKGGRIRQRGYVLLHMPDDPRADTKGYVFEHRVVWERANGRSLRADEHVHHINGIVDDNRPENLVALTRRQHLREHGTETFAAHRERLGHGREALQCEACGAEFTANRSNHRRFCSRACVDHHRSSHQ